MSNANVPTGIDENRKCKEDQNDLLDISKGKLSAFQG